MADGGDPVLDRILDSDSFTERNFAERLDDEDELHALRSRFHFPTTPETARIRTPGSQSVYLCGNSLGLQPKKAKEEVDREMDAWATLAVGGHFKPPAPWVTADVRLRAAAAKLIGAEESEVVLMNGLSVNLHLMLMSFYSPTPDRYKILVEKGAFPSDYHVIESQSALRGFPDALVEVSPREGEELLRMEDVVAAIDESVAVVLLPGVQYYTGQVFDVKRVTEAAHAAGAKVIWDMAHAVGNVELSLHDWDVDAACFCTYKYLNSGPGSIAGCFIHEKYHGPGLGRLAGWYGHHRPTRMEMKREFRPDEGALGWKITNPPILSLAPIKASLDLFEEATMPALRRKAIRLTAYLERLIKHTVEGTHIISPEDREWRGSQLSLTFPFPAQRVADRLVAEGAVIDFRYPNVIRVAPTAMYNSFTDCVDFANTLAAILKETEEEEKE